MCTEFEQGSKMAYDRPGEGVVLRQIVTEDFGKAKQTARQPLWRAACCQRNLSHFRRKRILDVDRVARFVEARDIAHPGGENEREPVDRKIFCKALAGDIRQTLRKFL